MNVNTPLLSHNKQLKINYLTRNSILFNFNVLPLTTNLVVSVLMFFLL